MSQVCVSVLDAKVLHLTPVHVPSPPHTRLESAADRKVKNEQNEDNYEHNVTGGKQARRGRKASMARGKSPLEAEGVAPHVERAVPFVLGTNESDDRGEKFVVTEILDLQVAFGIELEVDRVLAPAANFLKDMSS